MASQCRLSGLTGNRAFSRDRDFMFGFYAISPEKQAQDNGCACKAGEIHDESRLIKTGAII
jgi:hypothetical protein